MKNLETLFILPNEKIERIEKEVESNYIDETYWNEEKQEYTCFEESYSDEDVFQSDVTLNPLNENIYCFQPTDEDFFLSSYAEEQYLLSHPKKKTLIERLKKLFR